MTTSEFLISKAPDPTAAKRFLEQLAENHPSESTSLTKDPPLLSDVLTLVSFSPLFASTLLQDPGYIAWLRRERVDTRVRDKQTLLESLARFAMTHSSLPANVMIARFRRRELLRIFLKDVRRLSTVAEITEEVSNLADAILEHALRLSKQDLDNRFGQAQEEDDRERLRPSEMCVVSLGKLGSRELNYSSDIDLLFIFSKVGKTSGAGTLGSITNLEYFSKLAQAIIKLVGGQGGEGAAYRVDMRLRPHGRIGPLALTLDDTVRYYKTEAAPWERQVLIRSRASAGYDELFRRFFRSVEEVVFSTDVNVRDALENVALSKQKIDLSKIASDGTDVKLGPGGIREIEFIAQSLQLAHGGKDKWLRASHTLVSLDRLAERGHLTGKEQTELFAAYDFFRYLEHVLQVENGLQTHLVPRNVDKRGSIAGRLGMDLGRFDSTIQTHTDNVRRIFRRVFGREPKGPASEVIARQDFDEPPANGKLAAELKQRAPRFSEAITAHPEALNDISDVDSPIIDRDYSTILRTAIDSARGFGEVLSVLRRTWHRKLIEIVALDVFGKLELTECRRQQTRLAEASIEVALDAAKREVERRYALELGSLPIAVLALGKLGTGSLDYDSDLDLVMVFEPGKLSAAAGSNLSEHEIMSRIVEALATVISSVTRDGSLYRVDLRLRPHGSDGPLVISRKAILEYFREDAAIWEMLAHVNIRAVGGDMKLAKTVEDEVFKIVHERALEIEPAVLASETRLIRDKLERQKASKRANEIDFKFGPGGLLDVYFAVRFLQLRHGVRGDSGDRSTASLLDRFAESDFCTLVRKPIRSLADNYRFLSKLDHRMRLLVGRTSKLGASLKATDKVRNALSSQDLAEIRLTLVSSLLSVRDAYDQILSSDGR